MQLRTPISQRTYQNDLFLLHLNNGSLLSRIYLFEEGVVISQQKTVYLIHYLAVHQSLSALACFTLQTSEVVIEGRHAN